MEGIRPQLKGGVSMVGNGPQVAFGCETTEGTDRGTVDAFLVVRIRYACGEAWYLRR